MIAWLFSYLSQLLASNQFLQGGAVLGIVTWGGYQLKAIPTLIWNKIRYRATYTVHFDQQSDFYRVFSEWLNQNYPAKFRNVEVKFHGEAGRYESDPVPEEGPRRRERYELRKFQYSDANVIRYKNRWIWITKDRARLDTARDVTSMFYHSYTITGLFAKKAIDALCVEMVERRNAEVVPDELRVWFQEDGYFNSRPAHVVKSLDHLFFEDKQRLIADLNEFTTRKKLYEGKGIKYKRSYLFYGPGGTGKTSLGLAIAKHLDHDLWVVNLSAIKNDQQLQNLCTRINKHAVVLLEDIDCVMSQREMKGDAVNFATVLNFLDGLYAPSDCVFVMTTNKPEELDEALTRKGRVDLALHIDYPTVADAEAYMSDFYETAVDLELPAELRATAGMAAVQDICLTSGLSEAREGVWRLFSASWQKAAA